MNRARALACSVSVSLDGRRGGDGQFVHKCQTASEAVSVARPELAELAAAPHKECAVLADGGAVEAPGGCGHRLTEHA